MPPPGEKWTDGRGITHDMLSWRVFRWLLIAAGVVIAIAAIGTALDVFILIFAGILLAILLRTPADFIAARTRITPGWALLIVILSLGATAGGLAWSAAAPLAAQFDQLTEAIPRAIRDLGQTLQETPWGKRLLENFQVEDFLGQDIMGQVAGFFSLTLDTIGGLILVLFIGLYLAAEPEVYVAGLVKLAPEQHRGTADRALREVGRTLRYWLLGQLIDMAAVGILSYIGLLIIGVPLALILAVIAALLNFVSYIGPFVSVVPAALLALTVEPILALYVAFLYLAIQMVEGYILAPFIQRRTVRIPPALTIVSQVFLGVTAGILGILFAMPIVAAALTLVKLLYLREVIGEHVMLPGHDEPEPPPGMEDAPRAPKVG